MPRNPKQSSMRRPKKGRTQTANINARGDSYYPTKPTPGQSVKQTMLRSVPLHGVPHFMKGMLYSEVLGLTSTTGALNNYFFRANDAYDPNSTGTGHQPMGFDQMMLLYAQFYVAKAHISLTIYPTTTNVVAVAGLQIASDTTSYTLDTSVENGLCKTQIIGVEAKGDSGPYSQVTFDLDIDNAKYFGCGNVFDYIADSRFLGDAGTSPTELNYFRLFLQAADGASTVATTFHVRISYDVYFTEPRGLSNSTPAMLAQAWKDRSQRFLRSEAKRGGPRMVLTS